MKTTDLKILGKDYADVLNNTFFVECTQGIKRSQYEKSFHFPNKKKGIEFIFEENELICIHISGKGHPIDDMFKGVLPFDINIEDSKLMVYEKFGAFEIAHGGGEVLPILGLCNYWIKIKIDEYTVRFEFKEEIIVLITFAKIENYAQK